MRILLQPLEDDAPLSAVQSGGASRGLRTEQLRIKSAEDGAPLSSAKCGGASAGLTGPLLAPAACAHSFGSGSDSPTADSEHWEEKAVEEEEKQGTGPCGGPSEKHGRPAPEPEEEGRPKSFAAVSETDETRRQPEVGGSESSARWWRANGHDAAPPATPRSCRALAGPAPPRVGQPWRARRDAGALPADPRRREGLGVALSPLAM